MTAETRIVADGGNEFAFDLYARLAVAQAGNLFFSPSSIHTALALTYAGAAGGTADQMARTMHYPLASDTLAGAYRELVKALNTPHLTHEKKRAYELVISNALWPAKGYPFRQGFAELVQKEYGATVKELDYASEPQAARRTINNAVAQQTRDRIKDLVPESVIRPLTRLILTNAIYFKSNWADKFWNGNTKLALFTTGDGTKVECPMMEHQGDYRYFQNDDLQFLEMAYLAHDLSMLVLLPKKADGLPQLEKTLSAKQVAQWTHAAKDALVKV